MDIIRSIEDDIIVVSVIGKARTGKSYLMNLLLDLVGKSKGVIKYIIVIIYQFEVDSGISSCTQGIWSWGNFRKKAGGSAKIIFIDSEGTSAVDR